MEKETIFFSYAREDSTFVLKLAQDLRGSGAKLWLDQLDIKPGSRWDVSIENALKNSKLLLVVMTPGSVSSNNVMDEVSYALEKGKNIIPVLYKACEIPFRLRRFQFADFTDDYQKGLYALRDTLNLMKENADDTSKKEIASVYSESEKKVTKEEQIAIPEEEEEEKRLAESRAIEKAEEEKKAAATVAKKAAEKKRLEDAAAKKAAAEEERKSNIQTLTKKENDKKDEGSVDDKTINNGGSKKLSVRKLLFYSVAVIASIIAILTLIKVINKGDSNGLKHESDYEFTESGLGYKFHYKSNSTISPELDKFLDLVMVYGTGDSVIFDSRTNTAIQQMQMPMIASVFQGDIYEGLAMMHQGDSASFMLNADSVWIKLFKMQATPPGMESVEYIYFHVKLNEVMSKEEMEDREAIKEESLGAEEVWKIKIFVLENYPGAAETKSGLYIDILKRVRKGRKPKEGDKVKVHYTGTLLDGTKFDSSFDRSTPIDFVLGTGSVIAGWDEGIAMLRVGEKAVLIIPSELAYGSRGSGSIQPYTTLVYEVELIDIVD